MSRPASISGTRAGRTKPSPWNAGATPSAVASTMVTLGSRRTTSRLSSWPLPACILVRLLCFVASARAENPPQHIIDAMSSIAAGDRYARYLPGGQHLRRSHHVRELDASGFHLGRQGASIPGETRQRTLHRLVGAMVKTPLQTECGSLVPVALAKRIREAAINGPASVEADQIRASCSIEHRVDDRLGGRQRSAADVACRIDRGRDQQVRIVGDIRECRARCRDDGRDRAAIGCEVARQRNEVRRVARSANQVDVEVALRDGSGLADLAAIHPHEVGTLGGERCCVGLSRLDQPIE